MRCARELARGGAVTRGEWIERARTACERAGVAQPREIEWVRGPPERPNAVYRLDGGRYLKLYLGSSERPEVSAPRLFPRECCALRVLERGEVPAPRLLAAAGVEEGPPCVIVSRAPGRSVEAAWPQLDRPRQLELARQLGSVTRAFHRLPHDELAAVEAQLGSGREAVAAERSKRIAELEVADDLTGRQRDELLRFVREEAPGHLAGPRVFSHCDLNHAHFFVAESEDGDRCSAVIDWAEAMLVAPEWDLAYLWFWTFTWDRASMRACLDGYYAGAPRPERLARRLYAATLHTDQYGLLDGWIRRLRAAHPLGDGPMEREMTSRMFPPEVFGPPD